MPDASQHQLDRLPDYVFGALDDDARALVERHVELCEPCRQELCALEETIGELGFATPPCIAPSDLRREVLAGCEAVAPHAHRPSRGRRRRRSLRSALNLVAAPTLALGCVVLALGLSQERRNATELRTELGDLRERPRLTLLSGAAVSSFDIDGLERTRAQVATKDGESLVVIRRLPDPAHGEVWKLWREDDAGRRTLVSTIDRGGKVVYVPAGRIQTDELRRLVLTSAPAPAPAPGAAARRDGAFA